MLNKSLLQAAHTKYNLTVKKKGEPRKSKKHKLESRKYNKKQVKPKHNHVGFIYYYTVSHIQ